MALRIRSWQHDAKIDQMLLAVFFVFCFIFCGFYAGLV